MKDRILKVLQERDKLLNEILEIIRNDKVGYAYRLISKLQAKKMGKERIPDFFVTTINDAVMLGS